jgi:NAD(P)-dependent dehydrogenase (short-subunit alcohol dehydrogenase family)
MFRKIMLITGGGRGIGAATARLAAERGYDLALNYRQDAKAANALVKDLSTLGARAIAMPGDVSREADVLSLFAAVDREFGSLDVLVNNAGIVGPRAPLVEMSAERMERLFAVNVIGAMLCAREAVKRMSTRLGGRGGVIVNISSALVRSGAPNQMLDYAASKGAIDVLTVGLAREVAAEGIRVCATRPGIILTTIQGEPDMDIRRKTGALVAPIKRAGEPEEVAKSILWLASAEAAYASGAILDVAGAL